MREGSYGRKGGHGVLQEIWCTSKHMWGAYFSEAAVFNPPALHDVELAMALAAAGTWCQLQYRLGAYEGGYKGLRGDVVQMN